MIELLFSVIFGQMPLILLLLFKTPLRKLLIMALDRVKRGRGPLVLQSVAATVFVIMVYTIYGIREMYSHPAETSNPTDQVFLAYQTLQASLMGNDMIIPLLCFFSSKFALVLVICLIHDLDFLFSCRWGHLGMV